ncbi:MAG: hypothetical protein V1846_00240 [Candidatus Komeilibacteria bacterium]
MSLQDLAGDCQLQLLRLFYQLSAWTERPAYPTMCELGRALIADARKREVTELAIYGYLPSDERQLVASLRRDLTSLEQRSLIIRHRGCLGWELTEQGIELGQQLADCLPLESVISELVDIMCSSIPKADAHGFPGVVSH